MIRFATCFARWAWQIPINGVTTNKMALSNYRSADYHVQAHEMQTDSARTASWGLVKVTGNISRNALVSGFDRVRWSEPVATAH